jgi:hypothetical protein
MYLLKTKGTGKIPDYIQIRDENFVLINHIKAENPKEMLLKIGFDKQIDSVLELIKNLEYGELKKIDVMIF